MQSRWPGPRRTRPNDTDLEVILIHKAIVDSDGLLSLEPEIAQRQLLEQVTFPRGAETRTGQRVAHGWFDNRLRRQAAGKAYNRPSFCLHSRVFLSLITGFSDARIAHNFFSWLFTSCSRLEKTIPTLEPHVGRDLYIRSPDTHHQQTEPPVFKNI